MKTATFITRLEGWTGDACLYKLSEPVRFSHYGFEYLDTSYVIVSAVSHMFGSETYIFPANENGIPLEMIELPGSEKSTLNHERVLNNAGFELVY